MAQRLPAALRPAAVAQRLLTDFEDRRSRPDGAAPAGHPSPGPEAGPWEREVARFLAWKRSETTVGDDWLRRMGWELRRVPALCARSGIAPPPARPAEVTAEAIARLRANLPWEKATFQLHFAALRQMLQWAGNPVAARRGVWSLPSGEPTHRRWLTKEQLRALYRGAHGRGRLLVALEGLNGLRRVEVLRLRARDVALDEGCLRVLGKGRHGGKWRKVPIFPPSRPILQAALQGLGPSDPLIPLSRSGADRLLARSAADGGLARAGTRVSHHDLRRTFGRLAHAAGMDLIQLKNLLGHASVEMTVHYIGLDAESMREGLARLQRSIGKLDGSPGTGATAGNDEEAGGYAPPRTISSTTSPAVWPSGRSRPVRRKPKRS